jgi:hypothetical protein
MCLAEKALHFTDECVDILEEKRVPTSYLTFFRADTIFRADPIA